MRNSSFTISANIEHFLRSVRSSTATSQHVKNVAFSLSAYVAIPLLYLAATPLLVRSLGLDLFGLWMLIDSLVGMTGPLNFGFGESTLRFVSMYRGRGETASIVRGVRTAYSVSLLIALTAGSLMFLCAPLLANHVFKIPTQLTTIAIQSLEFGAALLALRVMESVFAGAFRGYERYDVSAVASIVTRGAILLAAVTLVLYGLGLNEILVASVVISLIGLAVQGEIIHRLIHASPWKPQVDRGELKRMFGFGMYAWLQSAGGMMFSQTDRLVIGAMLGTSALAVYSVCLQLAQQIHAFVSAGFSVLFPVISRRMETATAGSLLAEAKVLILLNVVASLALAVPVILFSDSILTLWMGDAFMAQGTTVLKLLACAFFILSINVALHYILLGAGDIKFVAFTNLVGGTMSLIATIIFVPIAGINAAAVARFVYGAIVSWNISWVAKVLG